ncbi:Acg family FMN-binding oxidoreductase [Streptomyces litchfieldiae]|uniref:Nitroreductase n=1 Tax=Streptomyces litchfieldiae TaxID=3075543 RepID=A0ABU2MUS6_9ACTN|nr:nitroreductase [Streptomyces sp. DSM 44938]MDT0345058.1 nitroreductase [Streptomyces sp. DSM 44938]
MRTPEENLVRAAVRAPSSHNTQPWIFRSDKDAIHLHRDPGRSLPVNDPRDREAHISCGAALLNLRVAAPCHGLRAEVRLLPDPTDDTLLARVELTEEGTPVSADDATLYDAITRRRTAHRAFAGRAVRDGARDRVQQAVAREGARLQIIPETRRKEVAALVGEGDRRQFADRAWRRELAHWLRPRRAGDGLTVPGPAAPLLRALVRKVNAGPRVGRRDAALLLAAPAVAVLTTRADEPLDWLHAGQALQRGLLTLAAEGIQVSFANQPCQVGDPLRTQLRELLPDPEGHPQLLFRVGHPAGAAPQRSPRRPLAAVMDGRG